MFTPYGYKIKAYCDDPALTALAANRLGAVHASQATTRDTYFAVPAATGRMKLREFSGVLSGPEIDAARRFGAHALLTEPPAALIVYRRAPAGADAWMEHYQALPVPDGAALLPILQAMLGTLGVVTRQRTTLNFYDVSIHFDEVANLGTFIEVAVTHPGSPPAEQRARVETVAMTLGLRHEDRTTRSAIDLLLK